MPSAPTLRLELRASRLRRGLVAVLIAAAVLALMLAPWPAWMRAVAVLVLLAICALMIRRADPGAFALEWRADGSWWLVPELEQSGPSNAAQPLQLRSARVIGPQLALRFVAGARPLRLDLWPDSADPQALRRLRIRLQRLDADAGSAGREAG